MAKTTFVGGIDVGFFQSIPKRFVKIGPWLGFSEEVPSSTGHKREEKRVAGNIGSTVIGHGLAFMSFDAWFRRASAHLR